MSVETLKKILYTQLASNMTQHGTNMTNNPSSNSNSKIAYIPKIATIETSNLNLFQ